MADAAWQRQHQSIGDKKRQLRIKSGKYEGRTSNWSQGGFLSDGFEGHSTDDSIEGTLVGSDGRPVAFNGRVVRVQENGMRAVQLVTLDSATLVAMQGAEESEKIPGASASNRARSSASTESGDSSPDS